MATPDKVPAEENVERQGPQLTAQEAREVARREGGTPGEPATGLRDREVTTGAVPGDRETFSSVARGASGGTGNAHPGERSADEAPFAFSETALGGADTVQKTSYGVGHGTEPVGTEEYAPVNRLKGEGPVVARSATGGGLSPLAWVIGLLAALVAAVYGFNLFT